MSDTESEHENDTILRSNQKLETFAHQVSLPEEADPHDEFIQSVKHEIRCITVEPLVFFYIIVMYLQATVLQQYIYFRVGIDYNITTNSSSAYVCDPTVNSTEEKEKVDRLQSIVSEYQVAIQLANAFFTILLAPFYCVFSDRYGRRLMLIVPGIGVFIKSFIEVFAIVYQCPIYTFIITDGIYGCFGGFNFAVNVAYSYYADISTKANRTKRLALLGAMLGLGALVISLISGIWIQAQGYLIPYSFTCGVAVLCLVYPIFLLQEPPKSIDAKAVKLSPLEQIKTLFTIYLGRQRLETAILITLLITFIFYYVAEMSTMTLMGTYLMAYPICMAVLEISFFSVINLIAINLGMIIALFGLTRCFSELTIVIMCFFSGLLFCLQMTFASTHATVYIAAATNILSFSAFPFIRGYMSKKMSPMEQGALFGGLVLFETVASGISKVVVIDFYRETFKTMHGLVYLFLACFSIIAIILAIISKVLERKLYKSGVWTKLN